MPSGVLDLWRKQRKDERILLTTLEVDDELRTDFWQIQGFGHWTVSSSWAASNAWAPPCPSRASNAQE
jgi:hypothetical protein